MLGVHVNSSASFARLAQGGDYRMHPIEVLTSIAATLFWRDRGNEFILYTDSRALPFYEQTGFAEAYNQIDVSVLDEYENCACIDLARAPCMGRMHVLRSIPTPFAAMDLDFVLFDPGDFPFADSDLCSFHWELPIPPWYPPLDEQFIPIGFELPPSLDFLTLVPNIAFLYVAKLDFFRSYAELAIDYVTRSIQQNAQVPSNKLAIFADQRLLGMLAHQRSLSMETLCNDIWTCGPVGHRWEVLTRKHGLRGAIDSRNFVSPFWVLDRHRFDTRKETIDCVHLWFEKPEYGNDDSHTPRRRRVVSSIIERIQTEFAGHPMAEKLMAWIRKTSYDFDLLINTADPVGK